MTTSTISQSLPEQQQKKQPKWAVDFPDKEHVGLYERPSLKRVCQGNERKASVLNFFLYEGSWEIERQKLPEECKEVTFAYTHDAILHRLTFDLAKRSLVSYLDDLNARGYVTSEKFQKVYTVHFDKIQEAISNPPERKARKKRAKKGCNDENVHPSENEQETDENDATLHTKYATLQRKYAMLQPLVCNVAQLHIAFTSLVEWLQGQFPERSIPLSILSLYSIDKEGTGAVAPTPPIFIRNEFGELIEVPGDLAEKALASQRKVLDLPEPTLPARVSSSQEEDDFDPETTQFYQNWVRNCEVARECGYPEPPRPKHMIVDASPRAEACLSAQIEKKLTHPRIAAVTAEMLQQPDVEATQKRPAVKIASVTQVEQTVRGVIPGDGLPSPAGTALSESASAARAPGAKQAALSLRDDTPRPSPEETLRRYERGFWETINGIRRERKLRAYSKTWQEERDNRDGVGKFYRDSISFEDIATGYKAALDDQKDTWLARNFNASAFFKRLQGLLDAKPARGKPPEDENDPYSFASILARQAEQETATA